MLEPFSDRVRAAVATAGEEARRLGHPRDAVTQVRAGPLAPAGPPPGTVAPRCASCGAALESALSARVLPVRGTTGAEAPVVVVSCGACGAALGVLPGATSSPRSGP